MYSNLKVTNVYKEKTIYIIMTTLSDRDYVRKVRKGTEEATISLSYKFLKEKNLLIGDKIDLRNLKKVVRVSNNK